MATIRIMKRSYDGYCVGVGVEYPGIIVSAKSDEDLKREFLESIPSYKRALARYGIEDGKNEVVELIVPGPDK